MRTRLPALLPGLAALALTLACQGHFDNPAPDVVWTPDTPRFAGAGVGDACTDNAECRDGLACRSGACEPSGTRAADDKCLLAAECAPGLTCGWSGFCGPAGEAGGECSSASDCARDEYCRLIGFSGSCARPAADAGDLGAACDDAGGCLPGLSCSTVSGTCVAGSMLLNPDLWIGRACPDESDLPFGARVHVPRPGDADDPRNGFYTLPYPSDVRVREGRLDLSDHPRPGPGLLGNDLVGGVLDALMAEADGFPRLPLVLFRFTRALDPTSLRGEGGQGTLRFVRLPDGAPVPFIHAVADEADKYICGNRLALRPAWSRPLDAGATYAVFVTTGVRSVDGDSPEALDDLPTLLADTAPADDDLAHAWQAYAPLRAYLTDKGVDPAHIAAATVFTTRDPTALIGGLRAAVQAAPAPKLVAGSAVVCAGGVRSPCATPGWASTPEGVAGEPDPRDCPAQAPVGYVEVHALLEVPTFQEGQRPYLDEGGAVHLDDGKVVARGREEVCVAFALPEGAPPNKGWPTVLYGHGTNGSFRSGTAAYGAVAGELGIALIGLDQPMHGSRRGVDLDPGPLFYNYGNPPAAKGNLVQGAADGFSLVRFAAGFDGALAGLARVAFDPARLVYMGHSQGATTGPLFVPHEPDLKAAVYTGAGGGLAYGLLDKRLPYDASVGVRLGLQVVALDEWHPVLALIAAYFEDTEPALFAPLHFAQPAGKALSVLNVMGWDDSYAPWRTGVVFAANLGGAWALPDHMPDDLGALGFAPMEGLHPIDDLGMTGNNPPISGNVGSGADKITGVSVAHVSDGTYDGHFVGTRNPDALRQIRAFLEAIRDSALPSVPK